MTTSPELITDNENYLRSELASRSDDIFKLITNEGVLTTKVFKRETYNGEINPKIIVYKGKGDFSAMPYGFEGASERMLICVDDGQKDNDKQVYIVVTRSETKTSVFTYIAPTANFRTEKINLFEKRTFGGYLDHYVFLSPMDESRVSSLEWPKTAIMEGISSENKIILELLRFKDFSADRGNLEDFRLPLAAMLRIHTLLLADNYFVLFTRQLVAQNDVDARLSGATRTLKELALSLFISEEGEDPLNAEFYRKYFNSEWAQAFKNIFISHDKLEILSAN